MGDIPSQPDFPTGSGASSSSNLNQQLAQELKRRQLETINRNQAIKNIEQAYKQTPKEKLPTPKRTPSQASQVLNSKVPSPLGNVKTPNVGKWFDTTTKTTVAKTQQFHKQAIKGINNNILKAEKWLSGERKPVVKSQLPRQAIPKTTTTIGGVGRALGIAGETYALIDQSIRVGEDIALPLVLGAGGLIPGIKDSKNYQELVEAYSDLRRERRQQQGWKRFFQPQAPVTVQPAVPTPFTGGQSSGVTYNVKVTFQWRPNTSTNYSWTEITRGVVGPVQGLKLVPYSGGTGIYVTGANGDVNYDGVLHLGQCYISSVTRADGQADTGGNRPDSSPIVSTPPPVPPPEPILYPPESSSVENLSYGLEVDGTGLASELAQILGIVPSMPTQKIATTPRVPTRYPDTQPNIPDLDEPQRDEEPGEDEKFFIPDIRPPQNPYISDTPIPSKTYTSIGEPDKNENHRYIPTPIAVATGRPAGGGDQEIVQYSYAPTPSLDDPFGTPSSTPIKDNAPNPTKSPSKIPVPTTEPKAPEPDRKFTLPLPLPIIGKADPVKGDPANNKFTEPQSPNQPPPTKAPPETGTECPCNAPVLQNQDSMLQKLDALQGGLNNALDAEILRKVNIIDDKMGDKVDGGLGGFLKDKFAKLWKSRVVDRAINLMTLATVIHNATMLSNTVKDTLLSAVTNIMSVIGIKDADDKVVGFNEAIGDGIENTIKSVIGAENYTNLIATWRKANRIYQAATNIFSAITDSMYGIADGMELLGKYNSQVGNALKSSGTVLEDSYNWMNENITFKTGQVGKIQKVLEGIQDAQEVAEDIEQISSEAVNVKDNLDQIGEEKTAIDEQFKEEEKKLKEEKDEIKGNSQSPSISKEDLIRPED